MALAARLAGRGVGAAGAGAVGGFGLGFFRGFFLLLLARGIVALALLLEGGDLDGDTAIVTSDGYSGIHLASAVVTAFAWALSLSRLTFAEFERTEGAGRDRGIFFVVVLLAAVDGDSRRVALFGQLDSGDEFAFGAVFILIGDFASFF